MNFVIHWNETALGLHVFPIPIPPPNSLSTRSLQVFPEHQVGALVSCIQPGLKTDAKALPPITSGYFVSSPLLSFLLFINLDELALFTCKRKL